MGFLKDVIQMYKIAHDPRKMMEYNKNILMGKDIYGNSNYQNNIEERVKRLQNLERCSVATPRTSQTVLYEINETKRKLSSDKLSSAEINELKDELISLYDEYESLLGNEHTEKSDIDYSK